MTEILVKKTEKYIKNLLAEQMNKNFLFHTQGYAKKTIGKAEKILEDSEVSKNDRNEILIATCFIHAGYAEDYNNHVEESVQLASNYLQNNNVDKDKIDKVLYLIRSAWNNKEPKSVSEKIVKDVRTWFYASEDFEEMLQLLRLELENFDKSVPDMDTWRLDYVEELRVKHRFYTEYAKENWQEEKEDNILSLISRLQKAEKTERKEVLKAKLKDESPQRAIQSLYRIELRNHIKLSDIADTKANILLSVNAIIISLLLANLLPKLDTPSNSYLIYPTVIFVLFSIASMIMSVLATRPKVDNEDVVENEINKKDTNYLFFGNFHTMNVKDFKSKIRDIIKSQDTIYDSLSMDLYYLGKVLQEKYRLLRWTYTIFIIGIILSVVAFGFALKYYGMEDELLDAVTPIPEQ
ncbi:Pycsar system effector family protein [Maribacter litoralis]|uniref:Pycsar system effector family protein n=1 Tax=Maribacter litoralis TaxID=2059726 RepID=UPI000E30E9E1|nr:Pycsar system effector family protein [Maribacter litoralis]